MSRDWSFYVEDIAECCAKNQRYTKGMDFETFVANEQAFDTVIRNLEIIGEAAKQLPDTVQAMMPEIALGDGGKISRCNRSSLFRFGQSDCLGCGLPQGARHS